MKNKYTTKSEQRETLILRKRWLELITPMMNYEDKKRRG